MDLAKAEQICNEIKICLTQAQQHKLMKNPSLAREQIDTAIDIYDKFLAKSGDPYNIADAIKGTIASFGYDKKTIESLTAKLKPVILPSKKGKKASKQKKATKPKEKKLYHDTSRANATAMAGVPNAGTINVSIGRGEFGRGFYTQDSIGNALRRGQLLYGGNGAILALAVDKKAYHSLNFQRLSLNSAQMLEANLRTQKIQGTYTTTHDAIVGPLAGQPRIMQQKFQTQTAAGLLNGTQTTRTII